MGPEGRSGISSSRRRMACKSLAYSRCKRENLERKSSPGFQVEGNLSVRICGTPWREMNGQSVGEVRTRQEKGESLPLYKINGIRMFYPFTQLTVSYAGPRKDYLLSFQVAVQNSYQHYKDLSRKMHVCTSFKQTRGYKVMGAPDLCWQL